MKIKMCAVILCLLLICGTTGCITINMPAGSASAAPDENSRVESTVKDFIKAYNKSDVDAMLNYIDPAIAKSIRATIQLAGGFLGDLIGIKIDVKYLIDALPLFSALVGDADTLPQLKIINISSDIDEDIGNVYVEMEIKTEGNNEKNSSTFEMEMTDGNWYIINFK